MNDKQQGAGFLRRLGRFIAERRFFLILLVCAAALGGTAWIFSSALQSTQPKADADLQARVTAPPVSGGTAEPFSWMPTAAPAEEPPPQRVPAPDAAEDAAAAEAASESAPAVEAAAEAAEVMAAAFDWPVKGDICAGYRVDALQYDRTMADWRTHGAIDIEADLGEKVRAAADGTVERVYSDQMYGVTVVLYHGGGLRSIYCNLAGTPAVQAGDTVALGQVIGAVGGTADAENGDVNHLHFAMTLDDMRIDPTDFLPER